MFRIWNSEHGHYVDYETLEFFSYDGTGIIGTYSIRYDTCNCDGSCGGDCSETVEFFDLYEDDVIEQFTGLKDSNGVKIFEGDKLNWIQFNFTVICEWDNDMAKFFLKAPYKLDSIGITRFTRNQFEIIGNIHEESK